MDRRSWLWRRKSSDKTPGDTESSGSVSSPSERFSDEQVISIHKHSPDITSKASLSEETTENTKSLTEQLSPALLSISANEELVKQHAKVAEEAVTGWEKAERELSALKLQHDATVKKNSALEERVSHLDGALKECVRQLRQAKDEQGRKIEEIIAKRTREWESRKSELESQLIQLSSQLEAAKSEAASFRPKFSAIENENKFLRIEIGALSKKLEVTTQERDFSTQTAESASKQRLDSIKKLAKLEAECRKLRRSHNLETEANKIKDADSNQSDSRASPSQVILMDDFLEMEKFAALPDKGDRTISLKAELEKMIIRMTDPEEKIKNLEAEKAKLEKALSESQAQLKISDEELKITNTELMRVQTQLIEWQDQLRMSHAELIELQTQLIEREDMLNSSQMQLKDAESNLIEMQIQLTERDIKIKASQGQTNDMEARLMELQTQLRDYQAKLKASELQLVLTDKLKHDVESNLEASSSKLEKAELQVKALKSETSSLLARIKSLVDEAENERALSAETMAICQRLEDELYKRSHEVDPRLQHLVSFKAEKKAEQEKGLVIAAGKLADCQKTIASLGKQLNSLATLDNFLLDSDNPLEFSKEVFFRTNEPGKVPCIDCQ